MTTRNLVTLIALAFVWGGSFVFVRVLVTAGVEPPGVSAARTGFGLATILPLALVRRGTFPRDARTWAGMAVLGIMNFGLPWTLFSYGQQFVPSSIGSITNAAQPIWAAIVATILIKGTEMGPKRIAGLALGFSGVVVLMSSRMEGLDAAAFKGIPIMVLATVCYGVCTVAIRRWFSHVAPLPLTVGQMGFSFLFLAPIAFGTGAYSHADMGWHEWASMLVLGGVGSGFAIVLYMRLISEIGPVRAAAVTYLMPPIGVFMGWLLLDEGVEWPMLAGLALIISGVAVVQGLRFGRGRRPEPIAAASPAGGSG